jgi:uncharacterized protein HemY
MNELGRLLFFAGLVIAGIGLFLWLGGRIPFGKLPGDIVIQRENFSFYFPLTTCLLISAILTLLFWVFRR